MSSPSQPKLSLRRPITSYAKVQALVGNLIRNRLFQLKRVNTRNPKYLDVGCGRNPHEDFINLDYLWHPKVDVCWDITRGLPFPDGSIRGVFSEHCLEHFSVAVAAQILRDLRRVIQPGGTIRIVVPDGELYLRIYNDQKDGNLARKFPFQEGETFCGLGSPILSVNRVFYQDRDSLFGHRFIYDASFLCAMLEQAGFDWANKVEYRHGKDAVLLIDNDSRRCESLYVEAGVD